jgi:low temperature requirement protein LtrA
MASPPVTSSPPAQRVTTLELFFDLVFVFTVTQLTTALADHFGPLGLLRVALMLALIMWMYGGYAWLTNVVSPTGTTRRLLLMCGMVGYLVCALAVPGAFTGDGLAFGLGYLVVNLVHTALYLNDESARSTVLWRMGPLNLVSALLVLAGGLLSGTAEYVLFALALGWVILTPRLHRMEGFQIRPAHFVERHGLVVIIALGESVVAIGVGAAGLPLTVGLVGVAALGLALSFALWWVYFGDGDDERAERALDAVPSELERTRLALHAYFYAQFPLLLGIVMLAAGVKKAIGHAADPLAAEPALALACGAALFLVGCIALRLLLRTGPVGYRAAMAALVLPTAAVGVWGTAVGQLAVLVLLLAAGLVVEHRAVAARPAGASGRWRAPGGR